MEAYAAALNFAIPFFAILIFIEYGIGLLMGKKTIEEINKFLSELYHRNIYTLDFRQAIQVKDEKQNASTDLNVIINLLTLLNGNSSYEEFFKTFDNYFKQWNHTIDIQHGHKFIPG